MKTAAVVVISCVANRTSRQKAVVDSWAAQLPESLELFIVEGGHAEDSLAGRHLHLSCPDGYDDLAEKTFRAVAFLSRLRPELPGIIKCDDDTYLDTDRLLRALPEFGDYSGNPASDQTHFAVYARGGCYWLSRTAMRALTAAPFESWTDAPWFKGQARMRKRGERAYRESVSIEDAMVGDILSRAGIRLQPEPRFLDSPRPCIYATPDCISNHYVPPAWMRRMHAFRRGADCQPGRLRIRLITSLFAPRQPR